MKPIQLLESWRETLASTAFTKLPASPMEAFNRLLEVNNSVQTRDYDRFAKAFDSRFGFFRSFPSGIPGPGWHLTKYKAMKDLCESQKYLYSVPDDLEKIAAAWRQKHRKSEVVTEPELLVNFEHNEVVGGLWIGEVSALESGGEVGLFCGDGCTNCWYIADSEQLFRIHLGFKADDLPLLRAMVFMSSPWREGVSTPLMLEWIFAGGQGRVLETVDDCLSNRRPTGSRSRVSYTAARNLVRRARGI